MKFRYCICFSFIFLIRFSELYGQFYRIEPNDSIMKTGSIEDLQTLTIRLSNSGNDTLNFDWKLISSNVPDKWEAAVCDNNNCYTSLVDSGSMNPVLPGDYGFILLHITPHIQDGIANVKYAVHEKSSPNKIDTLTFILSGVVLSAQAQLLSKNSWYFYLDPLTNKYSIHCAKSGQVQLLNQYGLIIQKQTVGIGVSQLSWDIHQSGVYYLRFITNQFEIKVKKIIIQNHD